METKNKDHLYITINPMIVVWVFLIALLFFVAYILSDLLLVILASVLLAAAISPAARWLVRRKIPRIVAVLMVYAGILFSLAFIFYFLFIPLIQETFSFLRNLPEYFEAIESWTPVSDESIYKESSMFAGFAEDFSVSGIMEETREMLAGLSQGFANTLFSLFGGVLNFVLIIVLSFYLSVQENGVAKFLRLITPTKNTSYVLDLWNRAELKIGYWMQGQLILAVIVTVLVYLCLTLLGIPHALLLAVLAGVFELIPVFGPILAAIPAIAIAMMEGGNFMEPGLSIGLVVTGFYIIIQQFESQLIYPLVIQKVVGLSPIIVIIALIAGYNLGGFLGIILSVPLTAILIEFLNDMQKKYKPMHEENKLYYAKDISKNKKS